MKKLVQDKNCMVELGLCLESTANYKELGDSLFQSISSLPNVKDVTKLKIGMLIIIGAGDRRIKLKGSYLKEKFRGDNPFAGTSDIIREMPSIRRKQRHILTSGKGRGKGVIAEVLSSLMDNPGTKYGPVVVEQYDVEDRKKPNRNWTVMNPDKRRRKIVLQQSRIAEDLNAVSSEDIFGYPGIVANVTDYFEDRNVDLDGDLEKSGVVNITVDVDEVMSQENLGMRKDVQGFVEQNFIPEAMGRWNLKSDDHPPYDLSVKDVNIETGKLVYNFRTWYSPDEVVEWSEVRQVP